MPSRQRALNYIAGGGRKSRPQDKASVEVVYKVLSARGDGRYTVREIAQLAGYSVGQTHRALRTLAAQGRITWKRAPKLGSQISIARKFNCGLNVHPQTPRGEKEFSLTGPRAARAYARFMAGQLGSKALPWALAQVRNDLRERPSISPARRAVILGALGPAVHRAIARGHVRTRQDLKTVVSFILARLDERKGLGQDYPATRRWAEWCVREALRALEEDRRREEETKTFLSQLRAEAEEARRAWQDPVAQAQVAQALEAVKRPPPPKTLAELVPDLEERRRRYLALLGRAPGENLTPELAQPSVQLEEAPMMEAQTHADPPTLPSPPATGFSLTFEERLPLGASAEPASFLTWVKREHPFLVEVLARNNAARALYLRKFKERP